jgi:hypothetical protein
LAIITMQTMPLASWLQRAGGNPAAAVSMPADWDAADREVIVFSPLMVLLLFLGPGAVALRAFLIFSGT